MRSLLPSLHLPRVLAVFVSAVLQLEAVRVLYLDLLLNALVLQAALDGGGHQAEPPPALYLCLTASLDRCPEDEVDLVLLLETRDALQLWQVMDGRRLTVAAQVLLMGGDVRRRWLLVKSAPRLTLEVENLQIVEFVGDFVETAKDDHVVTNYIARVPGPSERHTAGQQDVFLVNYDFRPHVRLQVECPEVVEGDVLVVAAAEDVHGASVDARRVPVAGSRLVVVEDVAALVDEELEVGVPSLFLEVVHIHLIRPLPLRKASKDKHLPLEKDC